MRPAAVLTLLLLGIATSPAWAQVAPSSRIVVRGRVLDAASRMPLRAVLVTIEGTGSFSVTDSSGTFVLAGTFPGPRILLARLIGYAPARIPLTLSLGEVREQEVLLGQTALSMPGIIVTADPSGRADRELATATVIDREGVSSQNATSLSGILELVPGVPPQPPGLDGVEQIGLRAAPTSTAASAVTGGPTTADVAAFGTMVVLDGVPVSNNANLQTTGPRGELQYLLSSSAAGGVDLRRFPASTIERVEVIRGVPSARYGDLTQGVIVVDTRAGAFSPALTGRLDGNTAGASGLGGWRLGGSNVMSVNVDMMRTLLQPGVTSDDAQRITAQAAHRLRTGVSDEQPLGTLTLDSRIDAHLLDDNRPEQPTVLPGTASWAKERALRVSQRLHLHLAANQQLHVMAAADVTRQQGFAQARLVRGATPFTNRLDEGRATGRFVEGQYLSHVLLDGEAWLLYLRSELESTFDTWGSAHRLTVGTELRREWNNGAGYQFDIEAPPQVSFNGVQGFDRPRRFDAVPPVAISSLYVDDGTVIGIGRASFQIQAGLRLELLHSEPTWFSGVRDAVLQPRVNVQFSPLPLLRLRAAAGETAKAPPLASLYPAPQYFDVVNLNWFTPSASERVAILTTFIRDPTNPSLGFSSGRQLEAGVEIGAAMGAQLAIALFEERLTGAVGYREDPGYLVRDLYDLADSTIGTGRPPAVIEPPTRGDTVPILLQVPANVLDTKSRGLELTASLPEIAPVHLRVQIQGSYVSTQMLDRGLDFGPAFRDFQVDGQVPRSPYWAGVERTGQLGLVTCRLVHHQPALGLVATGTLQYTVREEQHDVGAGDTLAFAGYITRAGELVPVAPEERALPEYADLRVMRSGLSATALARPADWLLSFELRKTLPYGSQLAFYAFNALDRPGRVTPTGVRVFPAMRFGLELRLSLEALIRTGEAPW